MQHALNQASLLFQHIAKSGCLPHLLSLGNANQQNQKQAS
jgi:hypothetical protein